MEYNLVSYLTYIPATFYITIVIGKDLNNRGALFLMQMFNNNEALVSTLNKFLLIGYYLINLGYAAISINFFHQITSWLMLAEELTFRIGLLLIGLGFMHYLNIFIFANFTKHIQHFFSNNTTN